jgi:hypothetical protein
MLKDLLGRLDGSVDHVGGDGPLRRARNSLSSSADGVSDFSNSRTTLRFAPILKTRLSRNADMTPIDIMLPVNRCTTGTPV